MSTNTHPGAGRGESKTLEEGYGRTVERVYLSPLSLLVRGVLVPTIINPPLEGPMQVLGAYLRSIYIYICGSKYICMYSHYFLQSMDQPGKGYQSCLWSAEQEKGIFPCARSRLRIWSRETGSAVPSRVSRSFSTFRLDLVLTHGIPPTFRGGIILIVHLFRPRYAIGSVSSLSGHAIAYRWRLLPRVCRHSASSPQGSSSNGCCLFRYHHGPINQCAPLFSHTHYTININFNIDM